MDSVLKKSFIAKSTKIGLNFRKKIIVLGQRLVPKQTAWKMLKIVKKGGKIGTLSLVSRLTEALIGKLLMSVART